MSKFIKINGQLVLKKKQNSCLEKFKVGHTYVPIKNNNDDLSSSMIQQLDSGNDKDVLKQYKHSENCALCRSEKESV